MSDIAILGGRWRAALKYPGIDTTVRLVSWGAGEMFDLYYPHLGLKVDYGVCPWTGEQGLVKHGVSIRHPRALREEDPEKVLIVIFAGHWAEILRQIADIGPFKAVRAISESATDPVLRLAAKYLDPHAGPCAPMARDPARRVGTPDYAIVMQGPIYPHWTRLAMLWNKTQHPDAWLILSTWDGQDPALVEECRTLADELAVSPVPLHPGFTNRNAQIRSSRQGLEAAQQHGIPFSIKSRSDQFLTGQRIASLFRYVAPVEATKPSGPHRVGVHFGTSWKYIPFQLSDQLQGGRTRDLLQLWSCPDDARGTGDFECEPGNHFQKLRDFTNESYVYGKYAAGLGLPTGDLADSYAFVRDCVFPLDASVQPFSLKGIALFDVFGGPPEMQQRNAGRELLSPGFEWWMMMQVNFSHAEAEAWRVQASQYTVQDFWTLKVR